MRFKDKNVIVTGAARGIGRATVERFVAEGANVLAVDLDFGDAGGIDIVNKENAAQAHALALDLSGDDAPRRVVEAARQLGGHVDFLINNAGVGGSKALALSDDALIDRILAINLRAVLRLTRDMLPGLADGSSIVNVASVFGETGFPGSTAYAVSKAGVSQLTRQLVSDLSSRGIRVNAVAPGVIHTAMTAHRLSHDADYNRTMVDATPLKSIGTSAQVASVIAFLCSEDASYVTGQVIAVDGGWLACHSHA
jgi:NAD(P)-dependent dehydrogenase (short-subunit alcohol dehydrogenase family)